MLAKVQPNLYFILVLVTGTSLINCQYAEPDLNRQRDGRAEDSGVQVRAEEIFENSYPGIEGRPGVDFPIYSSIPRTSFSCQSQSFNGIFADPETQCQVFHMCQPQGFVDSFLCPNGTIFNQKVFVCDWWFNVDCDNSNSFYDLNSNIYVTPVREIDNNLDSERRSLEERNEPTEQPRPIPREPATRRPATLRPFTREPQVTREVTKAPVTRSEYTRQPADRSQFTRQPVDRTPFTRQPVDRTPFTRQPVDRVPFTRQPADRVPFTRGQNRYTDPPTTRPKPVTRRPITRDPPTTRNPFIVIPETRRPVATDEPKIITRPTTRPISVGRAITVTEHKGHLRPAPLPVIIPRQKIQIFPLGFGQRINRKVETPPKDSFEDILNIGQVDNDFSARSGRSSESIDRDIDDIVSAFPGPRRLR